MRLGRTLFQGLELARSAQRRAQELLLTSTALFPLAFSPFLFLEIPREKINKIK
jgi:hypothetical protein